MHKYELLRLRAEELRTVLEQYAQEDPDVADFLERWMPWYERIQRREIRLPCDEYRLGVYFTNPDFSPLVERYMYTNQQIPLGDLVAKFEIAMADWLSSPSYLARRRANGESPDLIPDEPPPPEEEVPLSLTPEPERRQGLKSWLHRLIFVDRR